MPALSTLPTIYDVTVTARPADPAKVDMVVTYRAWYNQTLVEVPVYFTSLAEGLPVDWWDEVASDAMSEAFADIGYSQPL